MSEVPDPGAAGGASANPQRSALLAAVEVFAASRNSRILLDIPGRLGADAVGRARPISGARRASRRAQAAMEEAAAKVEKARDRWGALMGGLAADLDMTQEELAQILGDTAARLAIHEARAAIAAALGATRAAGDDHPERVGALEDALSALNRLS